MELLKKLLQNPLDFLLQFAGFFIVGLIFTIKILNYRLRKQKQKLLEHKQNEIYYKNEQDVIENNKDKSDYEIVLDAIDEQRRFRKKKESKSTSRKY